MRMISDIIAQQREERGKLSHIPVRPSPCSEKMNSRGNTSAAEIDSIVAYSDFSIASMKLCVENVIQRVTYVKAKTCTAKTA